MYLRVGKVTNVYPSTGKIQVMYEDAKNASLPLSMLTMNNEYSMPAVGDRVATVHMGNGSSKGFVLGTYYGGGTQPKANSGYRKDLGGGAYVVSNNNAYELYAGSIGLRSGNFHILLKEDIEIAGNTVLIESAGGVTVQSAGGVTVQSDGGVTIQSDGGSVTIQGANVELECSYGKITVEELMKRMERIEDALGLPHTI